MLLFAVQPSDSVTHTYVLFIFFSNMVYHRILDVALLFIYCDDCKYDSPCPPNRQLLPETQSGQMCEKQLLRGIIEGRFLHS